LSDPERKLDRLDNAFLFLLSFIGLVIAIIQVYIVGITGLLETLPLIFIGIAVPFYIGYLRGAISIDPLDHSLVERMRGWIYLIVGVSAYIGYVASSRMPYVVFWFSVPFNSCIAVGLILIYFFLKWVINIFEQEIRSNISHEYAPSGTIVSALLFPFFLRMVVSMYSDLQPHFQYSSLLIFFVWFTLFITCLFVFVFEKVSRNIINANLPLNARQIETLQQRRALLRFFIYISDIYNLAFQASLKSTFLWTQGLLVGSLGLLLFALRIPIFSDTYLLGSIFLIALGTDYFRKLKINFSQLVPLGRLGRRTQG